MQELRIGFRITWRVVREDEVGRAGTESGYGRRGWSSGVTKEVVQELNLVLDDVVGH